VSRFGQEYRVGRSRGVCAATGQPLEGGSVYLATLCDRPDDDGFDRLDFSLAAWESGARPEGLVGYWRTTLGASDTAGKPLVDEEVLMDLFEALAADTRRGRVAYRFVLALMLLRRKRLKYVGRTGKGANERWLMVPRGSEATPPLEVVNPHLRDDEVRELADQLGDLLPVQL